MSKYRKVTDISLLPIRYDISKNRYSKRRYDRYRYIDIGDISRYFRYIDPALVVGHHLTMITEDIGGEAAQKGSSAHLLKSRCGSASCRLA